jgi:hypothetical protein
MGTSYEDREGLKTITDGKRGRVRRSVLDILITGYFSTLIVRSKGYKKAVPSLQELFHPPF